MRRARKATCLWRLHWTLRKRFEELEDEWREQTGHELTLYSGADSKHGWGSNHYWGGAADVRTWVDPTQRSSGQMQGTARKQALALLKRHFGRGFDVIDEGTHFHVEVDPKTAADMRQLFGG